MRPRAPRPLRLVVPLVLLASSCGQLRTLSTQQALDRLNIASTKLYAADGSVIANLHGEINRDIVPLMDIPKHVQDAVIAIEDERFWIHGGVDFRSIVRAVLSNLGSSGQINGQVQGGSTLSQQLVKNLYFTKPERTLRRKIAEARITLQFEHQYSKRKILEMYLNTVYLGRGVYGIQTAARSYFHKDARQLTLSEGAYLAGLIHEPGRYEFTDRDPPERRAERIEAALARRNVVLERMRELHLINDERARAASIQTLNVHPPGEEAWRYPYFVDMVLRQLGVLGYNPNRPLDPRYGFLGETAQERAQKLYGGGLRIYTTLDPTAQQAAEEAIDKVLPKQLSRLSAALAAVEPSTGYIRAVVGGRDYYPNGCDETVPAEQRPLVCRLAKVNLALGDQGGGSGRQPGSSFKPYVLAAALMRGVGLYRSFDSSPFSYSYAGGVWKIANYEGEGAGSMDLVDGTVNSVNAVYAHLEIDGVGDGNGLKGAARVAALARQMGVSLPTEEQLRAICGRDYGRSGRCTPADQVPAIALGAKEVSPLDQASAYSAFANDGVHVQPTSIVRVTDASGKTVYEADPHRDRALPRPVALGVTSVLQQVIQRGTGVKAKLGRPAAGKTGTSQEWRDAWFVGYVPQLTAAVWVGNPIPQRQRDGSSETESMTPSSGYPFKVVGGTFPAMIWQYFMTKALADVPVKDFEPPSPELFASQSSATPAPTAAVPNVLGMLRDAAVSALQSAGFKVSETQCLDRTSPEGTVVQQAPPGGSNLQQGGTVQICLSVRDLPNVLGSPGAGRSFGGSGGVPDVVGESRARAQADIDQAGFHVSMVRECDPSGQAQAGRVWKQDPHGGSSAPHGSTVTIWWSPAGCGNPP